MKRFTWLALVMVPAALHAQATPVRYSGSADQARAAVVRALTNEEFVVGGAEGLTVVTEPRLLYPGKLDQSSVTLRATIIASDTVTEVRLSGTYRVGYVGESNNSGDLPLTATDKNGAAKTGWRWLQAVRTALEKPRAAP